jgi:hypothetical protein
MKKVLLAVFVTVLVLSCGTDYYDSVVSNRSAVAVTYTYAGSRNTLQPGESKSYSIALNEIIIKDVEIDGHRESVRMIHDSFDWIFTDVAPIPLRVKNYTGEAVTLTCEYLNNGTGIAPLTSLSANTDTTEHTSGFVYTSSPVFTAIDNSSGTIYVPSYTVSTVEMYVEIH